MELRTKSLSFEVLALFPGERNTNKGMLNLRKSLGILGALHSVILTQKYADCGTRVMSRDPIVTPARVLAWPSEIGSEMYSSVCKYNSDGY